MYADDTATSLSSGDKKEIDAVVNAELACLEKRLQGSEFPLYVVKAQAMIMGSLQHLGKIDTTTVLISHFQVNGNDIHLLKKTNYLD